ncbi:MAG: acyl-CoA dehydrogenase family protein [Burkholderiaceae bacterium]
MTLAADGALWQPYSDPGFCAGLRAFAAARIGPAAEDIDARDIYPVEPIRALANAGYTGIALPRESGGGGRGFRHLLDVFEEASYHSAAVGISLITIFQAQMMLRLYAVPRVRDRYLRALAGGLISSYALTEANHGSDIRTLDTQARPDGDGWVLDGEKAFITSGSAAELFVILAQAPAGVSVFLVPRDTPGVSCREGHSTATFGLRNGPHVDLVLQDVRVPADHLVGEEGKGVRQAVTVLDYSRTMAAGISLGIARAAFDGAFAHARRRIVFGESVFDKQGVQWYFSDALARLDAARLLSARAADALDAGEDIARWASEAKLVASALATDVASMAVQVCGAHGVRTTSPFGRYLRDAKAYEIAGGSSEVLRNTIGKLLSRMDTGA